MAYSEDAVKAKLNSLNETQDSIVSNAQWIMFHRRHADRTASIWMNRLQESNMSKRLNLIYLANEVVQQSRARSKTDFLIAFEPLIADATALAYKGASQEVQGKLRRVVEVWRQRNIFDPRIQEQTEKRLDEIDKQKGGKSLGGGGSRLGGSLFGGSGGSVAPELDGINKIQSNLNKAEAASKAPVKSANSEYSKMTDPSTPVPSAPVHAAKLRGLVNRELRTAHGAVEASIKARKELLAGLERLTESNRAKLAEEEATTAELQQKIDEMEATIQEVEDSIMRGQDVAPIDGAANGTAWNGSDPDRPEAEGFTPPPPDVEGFTPPPQDGADTLEGLPADEGFASTTGAESISEQPPNFDEPAPSYVPPPAIAGTGSGAPSNDFLRNLLSQQGQVRQASSELPADPRLKRRKLSHNNEDSVDNEIFGATGVDEAGISAMLGQ
ncbi:DUF618-domain-containing [Lecanosticta acicola]|uniref:DUF618-domain-containing n=1 Tax=Lecanosticta acicola TaxID=111012 RepID=A0AAI8Z264_9PEZI|nr:DUF618-domain-containing [Lecanosticta acicola]